VREAVGDDFRLMVDANNAWGAATALAAGREYDKLGIHWFEEPVGTDDRAGSARLAAVLDVPISGYDGVRGRSSAMTRSM